MESARGWAGGERYEGKESEAETPFLSRGRRLSEEVERVFFFFLSRVLVLQRVSDGLENQFSSEFRRRRKNREVPNSWQKQVLVVLQEGFRALPPSPPLVVLSIFAILYRCL